MYFKSLLQEFLFTPDFFRSLQLISVMDLLEVLLRDWISGVSSKGCDGAGAGRLNALNKFLFCNDLLWKFVSVDFALLFV